ncbi:sialate O-acetylesterase [uncultured Gimesia sp.]|uniref:sialate O-acetylesterase n=1 Tax=uncultured Gimesia sp. TaxID=1678688 RepID=UPI0030DA1F66|tara:strand:- start:15022 stop:16554 length:1533 start_codon:yes stop_codon:yes gene_type:complete
MIQTPFRHSLIGLLLLIGIGTPAPAQAELKLSGIFSDHMVLQRDQRLPVWGGADKGQTVTVTFNGQTVSTTTDDNGLWQVKLPPLQHNNKGQELFVQSSEESLIIRDVVVGDVWHASGQSNMAMTVRSVAQKIPEAKQHIADANLPAIRFRRISENEAASPQTDLPLRNGWVPCSPASAPNVSAAAFYFARKLHHELGIPIGVIDTSRGGTPIEPFIPRDAFTSHPTLKQELKLGEQEDLRGIWKLPGGVYARDANWLPGRLFHSRLAPITEFPVRGLIWYQGESNCGNREDPRDYQHKMRALITGWRKALGDDSLPVYFVQLPGSGAGPGWPYLREQQRLSSNLPHTGMVVTIDLLDKDIHPPNKIDVGDRLARWALAEEYEKPVPYSGPLFQRATIENEKITVHFSYADSGLMIAVKEGLLPPRETPDKALSHFELADASGHWFPAEAIINGKTIVVTSSQVQDPAAVRYACAIDPQHCHLYNRDGLPASPFCSKAKFFQYAPDLPVD